MPTTNKKNTTSTIVAILLLFLMASLMLYRAQLETTIVDESPHIVAGYAYNNLQDYRLNPEHPPLIKMVAALPLSFKNLNFPAEHEAWVSGINAQWELGDQFLHWSGNSPTSITFWSRIGPILITLLVGLLLFVWARKLYGAYAGLFALLLFVFSPNFLAHGPFVTTDVGAVFAFLFATYFFFKYLNKQNTKNLLLAGVAFGIAQLMKFSLILLVPYFTLVAIGWIIFRHRPLKLFSTATVGRIFGYLGKLVLIGIIGLLVIYPVYQYTVSGYPIEKQIEDTSTILESSPYPALANGVVWMADKPVLRAYSQYFLGHLMVFQRVAGGNTVYFNGEVANNAWLSYFPMVFLWKVPTSFLFLITIALLLITIGIYKKTKIALRITKTFYERVKKMGRIIMEWGSEYFIELALFLFVVIYWAASLLGNLNIGLRHVLPTFPFLYIILAGIFHNWIHKKPQFKIQNIFQQLKKIFVGIFAQWLKGLTLAVLVFWYVASSLSVYPHSLAYFNELAGGPKNGHNLVVDSNLDWGQDLYALKNYVQQNNIEKIKIDYFGTASPAYYLGDVYESLNPFDEQQDRTGWIAVSATHLKNGQGTPIRHFPGESGYYNWLEEYEPIKIINHSIFVYYIE